MVVHNAKELRSGKMLERLPVLLERMGDMLVRFLGTVQAAHVSFVDVGAFEGLTEPSTRGTRRLAGIDLNKARNRHVVDAVVELSTRPDGFTVAQLAATVRQRFGQDAATYSPRHAAYDLAKMVGKMLVRRIERSRRYAVDPPGLRTLCAYLLLRDKACPREGGVIKPLLAGVVRPHGRPPKVVAPWINITSPCATNSSGPFKPSAWQPPEPKLRHDPPEQGSATTTTCCRSQFDQRPNRN